MIVSNTQNTGFSTLGALNSQSGYVKNSADEEAKSTVKKVDTFEKQGEVSESVTYKPPKKLTPEQIEEINEQRLQSTLSFLSDMVKATTEYQADQATGYANKFEFDSDSADLLTQIFGSVENAYPTPATTPEGALANISEGGSYSIEAVSERIMLMATSIAGDDPEMLAEMREAVMDGFAAAGLNLQTGEGMPDITMDTYNHVMSEFDKLLGVEEQN